MAAQLTRKIIHPHLRNLYNYFVP